MELCPSMKTWKCARTNPNMSQKGAERTENGYARGTAALVSEVKADSYAAEIQGDVGIQTITLPLRNCLPE